MSVIFTGQAEQERTQRNQEARKGTWEFLITTSLVEAVHYARDHGWEKKKVQIRATQIDQDTYQYSVEPWEKDCKCRDILKFKDYFDPSGG